jgi:hypothetical protein
MKQESTRVENTAPQQDAVRDPTSPADASASATSRGRVPSESMIDLTLDQSFPASDPPSWTLGI